jgi:hypothetical protein
MAAIRTAWLPPDWPPARPAPAWPAVAPAGAAGCSIAWPTCC